MLLINNEFVGIGICHKNDNWQIHLSSPDVDAPIVAAYTRAIVVDVVELNVVDKFAWWSI